MKKWPRQVVVFASVEPGDVSTRWEGHPGLLALRDYLEYAAAEGSDGSLAEQSGNAHRDDPFEQQVARLLEPHGFSVVPQVGTQGVPVGLCVKHRDCGDRYLCAIGCDMPQGSSPEAERSRRRQLESRGWKLLRVWSVDWYQNPDEAGQRLLEQVRRFVYVSRGRWGIGR